MFGFFLVQSILLALVTSSSMFANTDFGLVFVLFFAFTLSIISFCFLMSAFFSKARSGATFAAVIFLSSFFGYFAVSGTGTSAVSKAFASLASPIAFGLTILTMLNFEAVGLGVNLDNAANQLNNYSYGQLRRKALNRITSRALQSTKHSIRRSTGRQFVDSRLC